MTTVRRRRRTRVGAVALATLVVVGGGLTVPRLLFPADGVAADGGSAQVRHRGARRARPTGGSSGGRPGSSTRPRRGASPGGGAPTPAGHRTPTPGPRAERAGDLTLRRRHERRQRLCSWSCATPTSAARDVRRRRWPTPHRTRAAPRRRTTSTACEVRHDSMPPEAGRATPACWLGDIWSVRIGADRARVGAGDRHRRGRRRRTRRGGGRGCCVAGLRDGWTQSGDGLGPASPPATEGPAPRRGRTSTSRAALAGWQVSRPRRAATTSPNLLCLGTTG